MAVLSFGFKVRMDNYTETIQSVEYFESWSTGLKLIMLQDDLMFALHLHWIQDSIPLAHANTLLWMLLLR
jgi:hypothetical protein